jgi:hypothetical protein
LEKKTVVAWGLGCVVLGGGHAAAEGLAAGARLGTPGLGIELTKSLSSRMNVRLGGNFFGSYQYSSEQSDVSYDLTFKVCSGTALVDFHPGGGAFRLSAGVLYNKARIDGAARTSGTYTIGGTTYTGPEVGTLSAAIRFRRELAPCFGFGFGNAVGRGRRLTFSVDTGVALQGSPVTSLTTTGPISTDARFQTDLARERGEVDAELAKYYYKYYPMIVVGAAYRF